MLQTKNLGSYLTYFDKLKPLFWFLIGFLFTAALVSSGVLIYFKHRYQSRVIPGVFVDSVYVGEKSYEEVEQVFAEKNEKIQDRLITFSYESHVATVSARDIDAGYDTDLIAQQTFDLGKGNNIVSDTVLILDSYMNGLFLPSSYTFSQNKLEEVLHEIEESVYKEPVDAQFNVENNRVVAFQESSDGQALDYQLLYDRLIEQIPTFVRSEDVQDIHILLPVVIMPPKVTTEEANDLGIVEVVGRGKSYFRGSIPNRIHNISLAASRVNGVLVPPGEEFSFNSYLGDVSRYTGYKEAYVISGGRTVLGDGGGVCQVSTTLFRALLNTGVPITERSAHSYRVSYYEQESALGLDATIYVPSVDLKFKNDTAAHILIQSYVDPTEQSLTYTLYGKSDGREVVVSEPVVTSQSSAPEPLYEDDPNLPQGVVKQVDFAAPGATVVFDRTVTRDGEVLIDESFTSRYTPWRAVFLRGTKEG